MQRIILYIVLITIGIVGKVFSQDKERTNWDHKKTFEKRARDISNSIEKIITSEKKALKEQLDIIEKNQEEGLISKTEALELKQKAADESARRIEDKVGVEQELLNKLIQDKVDGLVSVDTIDDDSGATILVLGATKDSIGNKTEINLGSFKVYHGEKDKMKRKYKRTTSQFVFAAGLNNVITEDENFEKSDFRVWGSHFYEWGLTYNTRIFKNNNLLHAKYGFSVMYNNLRPTNNRYFVKNNFETNLQSHTINLQESRLRNVYLVFPAHLEFDFTPKKVKKNGDVYFKTHDSFRIGFGGFAGFRVKSKQILKYEVDDVRLKEKQKGDFNASDLIYGVSGYIGYGQTSFYVKYDLNPVFKDNSIKQNNISLGVRFDFN